MSSTEPHPQPLSETERGATSPPTSLRKQRGERASRSRIGYAALAIGVIGLGLASRRYGHLLPLALRKSAGDGLWALMVFVLCGMLFPRLPTWWNAAVAMTFSACIEFSQIYHAPWIDAIRAYPLGHLILGSGFAWGDMLSYAVGIAFGIMCEIVWELVRHALTKPNSTEPHSTEA